MPSAERPRPRSRRLRTARCRRLQPRSWSWHALDLLELEEEAVPRPALRAEIAAWIGVDRHRAEAAPFEVLLQRHHRGEFAGERDVEHVAPGPRIQTHAVAGSQPSGGKRARRLAPGAVELRHLLLTEPLAPLENTARARIGAARLLFLLVGERAHAQREHLVDLGR